MSGWGAVANIKGPTGTTGSTGATGATGATGPAGATGATGAAGADGHSVLNGSGAPSSGLGNNGDFYIDTAASNLYGPKTGGAWGSGVSLVGPSTGAAGGVLTGNYPNPGLAKVPFAPTTLAAGSTVTADPTLNNNFDLTAAGNVTLGVSATGAVNGQMVLIAVYCVASHTVTPTSGTIGAQVIPAGAVGYFGFRYSSLNSTFACIAYSSTS